MARKRSSESRMVRKATDDLDNMSHKQLQEMLAKFDEEQIAGKREVEKRRKEIVAAKERAANREHQQAKPEPVNLTRDQRDLKRELSHQRAVCRDKLGKVRASMRANRHERGVLAANRDRIVKDRFVSEERLVRQANGTMVRERVKTAVPGARGPDGRPAPTEWDSQITRLDEEYERLLDSERHAKAALERAIKLEDDARKGLAGDGEG